MISCVTEAERSCERRISLLKKLEYKKKKEKEKEHFLRIRRNNRRNLLIELVPAHDTTTYFEAY